jgi:hypothetical protein
VGSAPLSIDFDRVKMKIVKTAGKRRNKGYDKQV